MVLHIQSRDRPRRTRAAAAEVCVQFLVCILQVVDRRVVRAAEVQASVLETVCLRPTMVEVVALEVTLTVLEEQGSAETDTKVSSSFVYRLPKFLSVK
jgi:hypothetical protein